MIVIFKLFKVILKIGDHGNQSPFPTTVIRAPSTVMKNNRNFPSSFWPSRSSAAVGYPLSIDICRFTQLFICINFFLVFLASLVHSFFLFLTCQTDLYHEPLAREIGKPLPVFLTLNKLIILSYLILSYLILSYLILSYLILVSFAAARAGVTQRSPSHAAASNRHTFLSRNKPITVRLSFSCGGVHQSPGSFY